MAELLAPAGSIEALNAAIGEGADAVYVGLKSFNARLRSSNFSWSQFEGAVEAIHKKSKKIFVTVNTVVEDSEMERLFRFLAWLAKIGPDGIIVQDFGIVKMVRENFPSLRIHASTQMNIASAKAANTMGRAGLSRIVLARELGLEEVIDIKSQTQIEIEVFIHGALCVSESGLCLFSSYLGGKSANRGLCTQACRRLYTTEINGAPEKGYYFSPYDLQLVDKIPDLIKAGVNSLKIEGRMKSAEYVGCVVSAYRYLIDNYENDTSGAIATAKRILASDFARAKTSYWYDKSLDSSNFLNPNQAGGTGIYLGKIKRTKFFSNGEEEVLHALLGTNSYAPEHGDSIRLHKKDDTGRESHKIKNIKILDNEYWIDIPSGFAIDDDVYLIQTKTMSQRYPHVLPHNLTVYRSHPGAEKLPYIEFPKIDKSTLDAYPDGIYIQVSTVSDMHVVLSSNPTAIILELNSETIKALVEDKEVLPITKKKVYLSLDPFFPQAIENKIADIVEYLVEEGYWHWIVNNPGHIALLRNKKVRILAGPYLYTFNKWSASWIMSQGISHIITPFENSRKNIENTFDNNHRKQVFITVFVYPPLFRMRFKLPKDYNFIYFYDKQDTIFKALSTEDGSFVLPENPFSIVDKIGLLQSNGFSHFILDFSKTIVKKNEFKQIINAVEKKLSLPETEIFNWKDGFYDPDSVEKNALQVFDKNKIRKVTNKKK